MQADGMRDGEMPETHACLTVSVLLAEDDADLRAMLSIVLRNDGHRVTEFSNGGDLEAHLAHVLPEGLAETPPLFVVADLRMPDRDGLTVMKKIFDECGCRPPFILMTAFGDRRTHVDAERLGAVAVLDKPFDFDELRGRIREYAAAGAPR
jgi:DNA-binding response OmpR family regulator